MAKEQTYAKINPRYLRRLLVQHFDVIQERTNDIEVVIICPEDGCPDKSGNRSINLQTGFTNCWRCKKGGHVISFLRRHDIEVDTESLEEIVASNPLEDLEKSLEEPVAQKTVSIDLPEGFTPIASEPDCIYSRLIGQMAQRKHLYLQDFIDAGAGFTRMGEWEPFCIFPVWEMNKLVYYQGRTYAERFEGGSTKRFPNKKDVPVGAGNWVYGYDRIIKPDVQVVIIVESILNVLSLRWKLKCEKVKHVEPVAVFKHAISKVQLTKLFASSAKEFCIMYDGDATVDAWEEAQKLSGNRLATVATMPVGIDANDDSTLAFERYLKRAKYTPGNALMDSLGF